MILTDQARLILNDLVAHCRNTDRRAVSEVARMARDSSRDHGADVAMVEREALKEWSTRNG